MTHPSIARRRHHLSIFATIWISLIVAIAASVHIGFPAAPLWMATIVGLTPALLVTDGCMTVANRRGWLRPESPDRQSHDDDDDVSTTPRWMGWFGSLLLAGLGGWFEEPWYDSWHHLYPGAPGWMVFVTILELAVVGIIIVELLLAMIVKEIRDKHRSVVHD